jgi:hypothetical protein
MREVGCTRRASDARDQVTCKHESSGSNIQSATEEYSTRLRSLQAVGFKDVRLHLLEGQRLVLY